MLHFCGRLAREKGLIEIVGSIVPDVLAAASDYADYAAGETILAISAPEDSAAGRSCGERCVILNRVMERLAAGLKQHAPQLVEKNRLLLATMDGEHTLGRTLDADSSPVGELFVAISCCQLIVIVTFTQAPNAYTLFLFGLSNTLQLLRNGTGSKNALPPGIPDPAAELGAPIDLRYPAVYITRRGHEDIDEVVDPEFL